MRTVDSPFTTSSVLGHQHAGAEIAVPRGLRGASSHVQSVAGEQAHALLCDPNFERAWANLEEACFWGTPWQSLVHAQVWYDVYREVFEPLLVFQYDPLGNLLGLLPLAVAKGTGAILHVGAHQAEYQVWLATEANSNTFIEQALRLLAHRYPGRRLKLQFLPPGTPLDWCGRRGWRSPRTILRRRSRPLLSLGPDSRVEASLKKKSNKSRFNRLQKVGPVRLVELQTREELERYIDTIADFCDFRQGAINASLPFRDDPRKKELWLQLLEKPGLVHASVLLVGDIVAAAHIGPSDGTTVSLGIIAHSPFLAEHSPGKVLMLMLARQLGQDGFKTFDLTPQGAYKDRFADHNDFVHTLTVYFDPLGYLFEAAKHYVRRAASRFLGSRARALARSTRLVRSRMIEEFTTRLDYRTDRSANAFVSVAASEIAGLNGPDEFQVNCVADLLLFCPSGQRTKMQFLATALDRLEAGDKVYTLARDGVLLHCSWISFPTRPEGLPVPTDFRWPEKSCLLWEDFSRSGDGLRDLSKRSMARRLQDAAADPGVDTIFSDRGVT